MRSLLNIDQKMKAVSKYLILIFISFACVLSCGVPRHAEDVHNNVKATYRNGYVLDLEDNVIGTYRNGYVFNSDGDITATYRNGYVFDVNGERTETTYRNGFILD